MVNIFFFFMSNSGNLRWDLSIEGEDTINKSPAFLVDIELLVSPIVFIQDIPNTITEKLLSTFSGSNL